LEQQQSGISPYMYSSSTARSVSSRPVAEIVWFLHLLVIFRWRTEVPVFAAAAMAARKPRILCLHGLTQSGASFSDKIGGARRKLTRFYDLDFLDGPYPAQDFEGNESGLGWWARDDMGRHVGVEKTFEYVHDYTKGKHYDAILGFSQGGLLATALALSGDVSGDIKAVVTAGAPYRKDAFEVALARAAASATKVDGKTIPKFHFAAYSDLTVPVKWVEDLSEAGGNGQIVLHEKGHMFPTQASLVGQMMDFLALHVLEQRKKPKKENRGK